MKKYLDDSVNCFKVAVPAIDENSAREFVRGNGEIIAVKDITYDCLIDLNKVVQALRDAQFGLVEIDLITRCLRFNDIAE